MYQILLENILLTSIIIVLILLSIVMQVLIGTVYRKLINEAENLSATENKHLKLLKLKFQNCYQLNGNVPNISVFVDKFLNRLVFFQMSLDGMRRLASQMVMLAVFVAGVGASIGIIAGETMYRLLPYYIVAIIGLYIYYCVAALVDIPSRRETLKINLMDYLENNMLSRLRNNISLDGKVVTMPISETPAATVPMTHEHEAVKQSHAEVTPFVSQPTTQISEAENFSEAVNFSEAEIEELLKEFIV